MKKFLLVVFIFSTTFVFAQKTIKIDLQNNSTIKSLQNEKIISTDRFNIKESIYSIDVISKESKQGEFVQLQVDGMQKTYNAGNPDLPVFGKLIEIPFNSKVEINVLSFDEKEIQLGEHGINSKIIPAQESVSKSDDPEKIPFKLNKEIYSNNRFFNNEFVQFEDNGYLRNKHLGFIQISPFEYNPVSNTIKVRYNFEIEVKFIYGNKSGNTNTKKLQSPYFDNLPIQTINNVSNTKALTNAPVKYVIVSDPMFEETLQPFIEWKKMKGFTIVEAYTNNVSVGTTTTSIKAYLKDLYDNPADGISPTFVLLVGDVAQIPAFDGTAGTHKTDLYYCEYTGDKLPEVFYGRFSATTTAQLQNQINKNLQVEKYLMPNKDYLNNVVLIAGADASYAPTYGNGFVNYANTYYINSENGLNSISYLYPASASADAQIRTDISNGVSLANYTAHCSTDGWADPSFSIANIAQMTNENMYPLMIGNCCQSATFQGTCFGEEVVRAENKGAVGYIGASNNSLWDEDYYWAIGNRTSITANPTYDATNLGAYDRFFHTNSEAKTDWYITQGQMNVAGNLAVQASTSDNKEYYWEIYHLMGDPSLTPFVKVPTALTASYNSEIIIGSNSYEVNTEEDAFVALSMNGVLLDVQLAGAGGVVNLAFDAISEVGTADLIITKQNRIPVITQISIIPSTTPYVIKDNVEINDDLENNNGILDYGETAKLNAQLKNVSKDYDAFNVAAKIFTTDSNVVIIDSLETYGTILKDTVSLIADAFSFEIETDIIDQTQINFTLEVTGEDVDSNPYTWNSNINFTINAPEIEIGELFIDDSAGDNDGILDPGETATLKLIVNNNGHASISELTGLVEYVSGSTLFTIIDETAEAFSINAGLTDTIEFTVSASSDEIVGTPVELKFSILDNDYNFYSEFENKTITIGEIPVLLISEGGTHTITANSLFYDSGGSSANYADNELYTITFLPKNANGKLKVDFNTFDVEENGTGCYDYLSIYDGENTSATKIGDFCSSNPPTVITATSSSGALTFKFDSDGYITDLGWEAEITNIDTYSVTFIVNDSKGFIENALVSFNNEEKLTNASGETIFEGILLSSDMPYVIQKEGFENYHDTLDINSNIIENITLTSGVATYQISFNVSNGSSALSGATIVFGEKQGITDTNGNYTFGDMEVGIDKIFTITNDKYFDYTDTIDVDTNKQIDVVMNLIVYTVTFNVTDTIAHPLESVKIDFNTITKYTDSYGNAEFTDVEPKTDLVYTLSKTGYASESDTIDVVNENVTVNQSLSVITSVDKIDFSEFSVYPNPSQGIINIDFRSIKQKNITIQVYDVIGKSVFNKKIIDNDKGIETIDITNQPKGLYFITLKTDSGEKVSRKIIIK